MAIETKELTPELWDALEALLRPYGCDGCWCYNHHIKPGAPDVTGESAEVAFKRLVESSTAHGVLAFDHGEPVGRRAADRRAKIPGHDFALSFEPKNENAVWSIHCFYVRPSSRGRGITHELLQHAQDLIRTRGGSLAEGYPTPPNDKGRIFDFCGAYSIFEAQGFEHSEQVSEFYSRMVKQL